MEREFIPYTIAVRLKALGFDEPCFSFYMGGFEELGRIKYVNPNNVDGTNVLAPTFSQAINFLYICSNKQIDIELKASDTYEERLRKIDQGCEDLWNLQNSKSN
jgi:hypothetical protein